MKKPNKKQSTVIIVVVLLTVYYFCLPKVLFDDPYSTVLEDRNGELLCATIAADGQWRFPQVESVPDKFSKAIIAFEDKRFNYHPGVDLLSFGRAIIQNIKSGKTISGGSTLTMQTIRLSRRESRTILEKLIEIILATRLELRCSKAEILSLYASHAPFGGNVVGIEAACWRYFGRGAEDLSWSEATLLAVLPNSPSLIHPGKNREQLKAKRNRLLDKLKSLGYMDDVTLSLSKEEPIPEEPSPLPHYASHMLSRMKNDGFSQQKIKSTLELHLQQRVEEILNDHHQRLSANQVNNAAALVLDVESGNVLAYIGNVKNQKGHHSDDVDVIVAPRSTGSILKPFLYAALLDEGKMLPKTLMPDVPTVISGFSPKNFSKQYDGAVPADKALIRSLNVPAVYMLQDFRYEKFHTLLTNMGMTTLDKPADHYGLTLILGGAEGTLWDITGMYASMSRTLNHFFQHPGKNKYDINDIHSPVYNSSNLTSTKKVNSELTETSFLSSASIYLTFNALKELYRPGEESGWRYFNSSKKIAWKTGTSFGFRDGWAIGVTPKYAVGVWVGNADGEGRPGLTGTDAAAPIMFDIFSQLPDNSWFTTPLLEMSKANVCALSGHRATELCEAIDTMLIPKVGLETKACPYHQIVHLSKDKKFRVNSACTNMQNIVNVNWFVLPPIQEYYFKPENLSYKSLPPFKENCTISSLFASMELVYPKSNSSLFIPRNLDGSVGSTVFELAHRNPKIYVYWHLDGDYIGRTKGTHTMAINTSEGTHKITLVDDNGETLERSFKILSKM